MIGTILGLSLFSFASAASVSTALTARQGGVWGCNTTITGLLSANAAGVYKPFTLNAENAVAYHGDGVDPLYVQFQECAELESGEPVTSYKSGRLYVPSEDKCIYITNQQNSASPYYTTLKACNTDTQQPAYAERWIVNTDASNALYWSGDSDEEGTILQGGCGLLGYKSHNKGVPDNTTHSNSQVIVECGGTPFRIVEDTTNGECQSILTGVLAANATGVYKAFTLNAENAVAYHGDGVDPLYVEFQECSTLESGDPTPDKAGRIWVPSEDKCIGITNQDNTASPYYTTLTTCSIAYSVRFVVDTDDNNAVYWSGDSDEEGTIHQGGCGLLGYKSHNKGVPDNTTHSNSQAIVECGGTPFRIVQHAS